MMLYLTFIVLFFSIDGSWAIRATQGPCYGCYHMGTCYDIGSSVDTEVPCQKLYCTKIGRTIITEFKYIGCHDKKTNTCIHPGESVPTGKKCERLFCQRERDTLVTKIKFTGCPFYDDCVQPGKTIKTFMPCEEFYCERRGIGLLMGFRYTGCYEDGKCHDFDSKWKVEEGDTCVAKTCKKNNKNIRIIIERLECRVTNKFGEEVCLGNGKSQTNSCENINCTIKFAGGKWTAKQTIQRNGCTDNKGNCIAIGTTWLDKSGRNCVTRVCGQDKPKSIACKDSSGICHEVNEMWGQYEGDNCRVYLCRPHYLLKVVGRDCGGGCSYNNGGCLAPGQFSNHVSWKGCAKKGCHWIRETIGFGYVPIKNKELTGCSDEYGECHPVPSYPINKKIGEIVKTFVKCEWKTPAKNEISYIEVPTAAAEYK